ncbi:hypothetical protein [Actinomadura keratinilytica]|uniref:hypothetical protein n=1 Tax=Actinomadura keratinilytica TaxID=547461 RepID=UPI00361090C9
MVGHAQADLLVEVGLVGRVGAGDLPGEASHVLDHFFDVLAWDALIAWGGLQPGL